MYLNDDRRVLLVDRNERLRGWYPLPGELATVAGSGGLPLLLSGFEGVVPSDFSQRLASAFIATRNDADYHTQQHNEEVAANGWEALDACAGEYGIRWPDGLVEASIAALGQHDLGHPQATFFIHARFDRVPAIAGVQEMTVEQYSAMLADERARQAGFTVHQRWLEQYWIWSSTVGAASEQGQRMGLSRIRPAGVFGLIMRVSDIVRADEFTVGVNRSIGLNFGETPATPRPIDLPGFLRGREGFLGYVEGEMNQLDQAAGFPLTERLGWRARLARDRARLVWFTTTAIGWATLAAELHQRGYTLARDGRITYTGIEEPPASKRTLAILDTNVVNSTPWFAGPPERHYQLALRHIRTLEQIVTEAGGAAIGRCGDGIRAIFPAARAAIQCAVRIQTSSELPIGVGISQGEVMYTPTAVYGNPVTETARLCQQALPAEILVPARLRDQAAAAGATLDPPSRAEFRGLSEDETSAVRYQ